MQEQTHAKPLPEEKPINGETPYQKHLRELRVKRYNEIVATIPADVSPDLRSKYKRYAHLCAQSLGRKQLATVHYPWNDRPQEGRVKRGNPRRNPTAIK